jgi:glycosyltransferase involved in cell wall biosynthesis
MIHKTISIVIPVFNEEFTLKKLVEKVAKIEFNYGFVKEIIIVNDGSKDSSWQIMQDLQEKYPQLLKIFNNSSNLGKSQTVKIGLLKTSGEIVVIQDADFEYNPVELKEMHTLMIKENLDVVYGNRFGKKNKVIYWKNYIGNRALSVLSNFFTYRRIKIWIPDMEVCYKMIKGDLARNIAKKLVSTSTFGLEPEITAKLSLFKNNGKHLKFGIVPISYSPRTISEGKKMHAFSDGFKALKEIIKFNLNKN